jgi:hypothetical protein
MSALVQFFGCRHAETISTLETVGVRNPDPTILPVRESIDASRVSLPDVQPVVAGFCCCGPPRGQILLPSPIMTSLERSRSRAMGMGGPCGRDRRFAAREQAAAHGARHLKKSRSRSLEHRARHIHQGSRRRSIETCEIQAPGDSMTNDWWLPFVRTVSKAVIVSPSTFASIRPLTFCPEILPPWRY